MFAAQTWSPLIRIVTNLYIYIVFIFKFDRDCGGAAHYLEWCEVPGEDYDFTDVYTDFVTMAGPGTCSSYSNTIMGFREVEVHGFP